MSLVDPASRLEYLHACEQLAAVVIRRPTIRHQLGPYITADDLPEVWRELWAVTGEGDIPEATGRARLTVLAVRLRVAPWRIREIAKRAPAQINLVEIVVPILETRWRRQLVAAMGPLVSLWWQAFTEDDGGEE